MRKSSKNAKWNGLSPAQRDMLEGWLFDERMSYADALALAQREFGFRGSMTSLKRFYQRASEARMLTDAVEQAVESKPSLSEGEARAVAMKAVGNLLVRQITENPEDIKEWWLLAKLLLQSQENELRERLQREQNELRERLHREKNGIRREHLELARERFQWNAVDDAEKALPEIQELVRKRQDPKARRSEFNKAMNAVRLRLFGSVPGPAPEDAEHEAEMADFDAQRGKLKPDEYGRYCMEKVRAMLAKGLTWVDICRRVDANVVTAAREAQEKQKREDGGLRMEDGEKSAIGNTQHSTPSIQRPCEGRADGGLKGSPVLGGPSSVEAGETTQNGGLRIENCGKTENAQSAEAKPAPDGSHLSPALSPEEGGESDKDAEHISGQESAESGVQETTDDECRMDADCGPVSGGSEG